MITSENVREALPDGDWSDETVAAVLAAEHSAQRSVLDLPSPRPEDADKALLARVVHNLTTTNGSPLARVGIDGDGVRDLERPWSRRRAPERRTDAHGLPEDIQTPVRPRRAVKKTAAKKAATTQEGTG